MHLTHLALLVQACSSTAARARSRVSASAWVRLYPHAMLRLRLWLRPRPLLRCPAPAPAFSVCAEKLRMSAAHVHTLRAVPCCNKCYCDCDDEGYWTPDANTIDGKCGMGYKRVGAAPNIDVRLPLFIFS